MRIAIIGCGGIAASHLSALKKILADAEIYLMDVRRQSADSLSAQFAVAGVYDDLDTLFAEVKPEAIHILTPPPTHFALAMRALNSTRGHVLLEKPATETVAELRRLSEFASSKGRIISVDYSVLGMPVVQRALGEIRSGKYGRLIAVHCHFAGSWPGNKIPYSTPHHWAYMLKGGVLQNMADHPASLVLAAMDPIREHRTFFASRNLLPHDCADLLEVMVRNDDQLGSFTLSLGHGSSDRRAHFLLEAGSITIDLSRQLYFSSTGRGPQNFIKKSLSGFLEGNAMMFGTMRNVLQVITGKLGRDPGIVRIVDNFYKAIRGEENVLVAPETALAIGGLLESVWNEMAVAKANSPVVDDDEFARSETDLEKSPAGTELPMTELARD